MLPSAFADIAVERLNEARAWLMARDDVTDDSASVSAYGTSERGRVCVAGR
jgi:hypothetical protein